MKRSRRLCSRLLLGLLMVASTLIGQATVAAAADSDKTSPQAVKFFESRIRPLLAGQCYECHSRQAKKVKGGLLLDTRAGWSKGGDSGKPVIVPGQPEESLLVKAVRHELEDLAMPPKKKLLESQIADLVTWVKMGAPDPRGELEIEAKRADQSWWSLQPLVKNVPPTPPGLPASWAASPIDRFVFANLAAKGLAPNRPADRRALIRRATYDLLGLPPTPEEVEAFAHDARPDAYTRLVERLLDSPRYGERWGRHWLDVVRFGESNGFERNYIYDDAWPFRDYVIRSFNEDKPFNQFIIEHLAGDVVAKDQPATEIGVAFLTMGPYDDVGNQDPIAAANIRAATVDDMVTATGNAFLGLTINCARCHNHKFDPVPTEDYYRMKAAFDGVRHGRRVLSTGEERLAAQAALKPLSERRTKLTADKQALESAILARARQLPESATTRPPPSAHLTEEKFAPVEARFVRFNMLASSDNPKSGVNSRVDEFEVWTGGAAARNVALAANGGKAEGVSNVEARDFAGAYDVRNVNDGKFSAAWIVGSPAVLTVSFAKPETIERVTFSWDRVQMSDVPVSGRGPCVVEYEIHVSIDGKEWRKVTDSHDRKAFNPAHEQERRLRAVTTPDDAHQLAELNAQIAAVDAEIAKVPQPKPVWAGIFSEPKQKPVVFRGGDPMKPGDEIKPASLNVLNRVTRAYELAGDAPEAERRLALAKWIASDDNPLTARVLANRVWQHHFGVGIVDTPSDFGFLGSKPTHPELLDWLALRLQHHGWRLKALHRDIMLSQAYQQATTYRPTAGRADRDARFLWRFPPRRLGAEEIRDTMLQVAGKLDLRMGGPGFRLYDYKSDNVSTYTPLDKVGPETYRRAVYHQSARASVVDVLSDFDLPDSASAAPKRADTTTPLQALTLLNHSFTLDLAAALSGRLARETGTDPAAQVNRAYAIAFQRAPFAKERRAAMQLIRTHGLAAFGRALLNANELIYLE